MVGFDSLAINLIMLIPTAVFAVFVEKHYTAFWTGFWNLFALGVTAIAIFFAPPPHLPYDFWNFLPLILGISAIVLMFVSLYVDAEIARIAGSSHIATSLLSASYVFQHTSSSELFGITLIGSFIAIFIAKNLLP